jgi:hypothetical protein
VFAVVDQVSAHRPRGQAAEGEDVVDLRKQKKLEDHECQISV